MVVSTWRAITTRVSTSCATTTRPQACSSTRQPARSACPPMRPVGEEYRGRLKLLIRFLLNNLSAKESGDHYAWSTGPSRRTRDTSRRLIPPIGNWGRSGRWERGKTAQGTSSLFGSSWWPAAQATMPDRRLVDIRSLKWTCSAAPSSRHQHRDAAELRWYGGPDEFTRRFPGLRRSVLLQLLHAHEKYDIDELGEDVLDQGYSPTNDSLPGNDPGVTAGESASHGDLVHWLKRKVLEAGTPDEGDRRRHDWYGRGSHRRPGSAPARGKLPRLRHGRSRRTIRRRPLGVGRRPRHRCRLREKAAVHVVLGTQEDF